MKLKYYLRGLGIGILVTAVIMSITRGNSSPMTDEEVKARARELGMVESTVLSNIQDLQKKDPEETVQTDATNPTETVEDEPQTEPSETVADEPRTESTEPETEPEETGEDEPEPIETETAEPEPETDTTDMVSITISSGQSSVTVSKTLESAGLVADAGEYDRFLCDNGYDKKLRVGVHEIPVGANAEEIARIITGTGR